MDRGTATGSRRGVGLALAVVSAATFGTSGTFGDSLLRAGWSPANVVTIRVAVAAVALAVPGLLALRGRWHLVPAALPGVLAFGVVAVAACQLCYFNAVARLPVSVALLLEYSGVLLVVAWAWAVHGQRPRGKTVVGGLTALVGLVMVLDLVGAGAVDGAGVLWGLGAATGLAWYFVVSARAADPLPAVAMAWGAMVVGAASLALVDVTGLVPARTGSATVHLAGATVGAWVPLAALGLVAAAVAYATGIAAARHLGARLASFLGLAEVLFAALFAWMLLGQQPGILQGLGGVVVIAGIALVRAGEADVAAGPGAVTLPELEPVG
jgi:drug/metabolite transporter (DMT)-like permease